MLLRAVDLASFVRGPRSCLETWFPGPGVVPYVPCGNLVSTAIASPGGIRIPSVGRRALRLETRFPPPRRFQWLVHANASKP